MIRSQWRVAVTCALIAQFFVGCNASEVALAPPPPGPDTNVAVVEFLSGADSIGIGWPFDWPFTLTVVAKNAAGDVLTGRIATWQSSDASRIKVASTDSMKALVSPVNFGSAIITATVGGKSAERKVGYILSDVPPVDILPDTSVMLVGTTRKLRLQRTSGMNVSSLVVPGPSWQSSDPAVAQVGASTGEVTILSEGHATISADVAGRHFTAEVFGFRYPAPLTFSSFSSGKTHGCGITPSGVAYCWGQNDQGQLGNAGMMDKCIRTRSAGGFSFPVTNHRCSQVPVAVTAPEPFASISAGARTTCALTSAGAAYCWGRNVAGMTGTGVTDTIVTTPLPVRGGISFRSIDVGPDQVCGVSTTYEAYCWGSNGAGSLGDGTTTSSAVPTRVSGTQSWSVVLAGTTACGITTEGEGYCWGANRYGEAGAAAGTQGCTTTSLSICPAPVRISNSLTFTHIGSRGFPGNLSCGLATGTAYCWGVKGAAGETSSVPVAVSGGPFTSLDAHGVCAVDVNGGVYCWQGYGGTPTRTSPTFPVKAFSVGTENSLRCATDANSILWCWDNQSFTDFMWWGGDFSSVVIGSATPLRVAGQP
jgi:hypothetical protein